MPRDAFHVGLLGLFSAYPRSNGPRPDTVIVIVIPAQAPLLASDPFSDSVYRHDYSTSLGSFSHPAANANATSEICALVLILRRPFFAYLPIPNPFL